MKNGTSCLDEVNYANAKINKMIERRRMKSNIQITIRKLANAHYAWAKNHTEEDFKRELANLISLIRTETLKEVRTIIEKSMIRKNERNEEVNK